MIETPYNTANRQIERRMRFHPIRVFTYLIILGISSAFFTLIACYFGTLQLNHIAPLLLPAVFHTNTIIILASSYSVYQMRSAYRRDDNDAYRMALWVTTGLGVAFCGFQVYGWMTLIQAGVHYQRNISGAYLYLISGLHILHLFIGIAALGWCVYRSYLMDSDALSALMFSTDPVARLKVDMLALYWHFVDVLWLVLYACFMIAGWCW